MALLSVVHHNHTGETLEWASLFSLKTGDKKGFDRHMAQLSVYYSDFKEALPESPLRCVIIGLNLLHLLVDSRRAELHAELELIAPEERAEPHIAFAINLEQHLMEGQYAQVLLARESMPSPHYAPFMDKLLDTVRDEIAECSSAAYKTLSIDAACKMLMFSSRAELEDYVRARADESWSIRDDTVVFAGHEEAKAEIQSTELIENTLRYASELERIV